MAPYTYSHLIPRPKSRDPFYTNSSHWRDVTPIPLASDPPTPPSTPSLPPQERGGALATIAYSQRYLEAMSYLRAVMAKNEFSERCLALTEDIIWMNPAHYTVWIFRMRCLRHLWGVANDDESSNNEGGGRLVEVTDEADEDEVTKRKVKEGVAKELEWLEGVSERNLKNYQIWHHRQSLLTTLTTYLPSTTLPPSELSFITHILSFDHKNYHVWTYRSWLCRHFATPLLDIPNSDPQQNLEIQNMNVMIDDDILNNSAWSHRYFVLFGAEELRVMEEKQWTRPQLFSEQGRRELKPDRRVVESEIGYAREKIEVEPMNAAAWNYLRGITKRAGVGDGEMKAFCESFVSPPEARGGNEARLDFMADGVRSSHAIDWLSEIYAEEGRNDEAKACLRALGEKWDPIRRKYWEYRAKKIDGQL